MDKKAEIFSIGGAKMLEMNTSDAVRKLSGAPKEALESNYGLSLTPMKDYAQAVEKYSGAGLDAFKRIFDQPMVPMQDAINVPSLQNTLVEAIENGFNNALMVNAPNEALKLSDRAKAKIISMDQQPVVMKKMANSAGRGA